MKFLVTRELGRLSRWLRILGYDALYCRENKKSTVIIAALRDDRIVVTRNNVFLSDKALKSVLIKYDDLKQQLTQLICECALTVLSENMFTRCIVCNEPLYSVDKGIIQSRVPAYVYSNQKIFFSCAICKRIYWQGTHWGNVQEMMSAVEKH